MNYRHAFHAGNHTEVFKHAVLTLVLAHLTRKPRPFAVLDTHAGAGAYDLRSDAALRTGEAAAGVGRIFGRPLAAAPEYAAALAEANPDGLAVYPGSPDLVRRALRPRDRLVACELHPDDAAALRWRYRTDPRVGVHERDGFAAVKALLPPPEKRGLVLIDPPYERRDDAASAATAVATGLARFPGGIFCVWYPVKDRAIGDALAGAAAGWPAALRAEFLPLPADGVRLAGGGLVLANAPYRIDADIAALVAELEPMLAPDGRATHRIEWLSPP